MAVVTVGIPLMPGRSEAWRRWMQELLGSRREEYEASRVRLGIHGERYWIGDVRGAEVVFAHLDVDDPVELCARLATSSHPFDVCYREQIRTLFDLDVAHFHRSVYLDQVIAWPELKEAARYE